MRIDDIPNPVKLEGLGWDDDGLKKFLAEHPNYLVLFEGIFLGKNRYTLEFSLALRSAIRDWEEWRDQASRTVEVLKGLEWEIKHHPEGED